jgi:hypothetical protein
MNADERRYFGRNELASKLRAGSCHCPAANTLQIHLRSSAFICGSIAFVFFMSSLAVNAAAGTK